MTHHTRRTQRDDITPEFLANIHPGNIVKLDYLPDLGITEYRLAKLLQMRQSHVAEFLDGKRGLTANWALRLGKLFGQSPEMWLGLQNRYDLLKAEQEFGDVIDQIEPLVAEEPGASSLTLAA